MKILILEPTDVVRELIVRLVAELGGEALLPDDPAGFPDVDAVILEPEWPAGAAVANQLRELNARLPIICVSVGGPTAATRELRPAAFLVKPFFISDLTAAIAAAVWADPTPPPGE